MFICWCASCPKTACTHFSFSEIHFSWLRLRVFNGLKKIACILKILMPSNLRSCSLVLGLRGHMTHFHNNIMSWPQSPSKKKKKDFISSWEFSCLMLPVGNPAARTHAFLRPRRRFPRPCTCSRSSFSPQTFFHLLVPSGVSIKGPGTEQTNTSCGTLAADTNIDVGYEALRGGGGVGEGGG